MDYKQFVIQAFETEFGTWRSRIWRANGRSLRATGRRKPREFITGVDAPTAVAAILMAMTVIDAGTFSRAKESYTEKFWRPRGGRSGAILLRNRVRRPASRGRRMENHRAASNEQAGHECLE